MKTMKEKMDVGKDRTISMIKIGFINTIRRCLPSLFEESINALKSLRFAEYDERQIVYSYITFHFQKHIANKIGKKIRIVEKKDQEKEIKQLIDYQTSNIKKWKIPKQKPTPQLIKYSIY
jgi:hypothetical protein